MSRTIEVIGKTEIRQMIKEEVDKKCYYLERELIKLRNRMIDLERI